MKKLQKSYNYTFKNYYLSKFQNTKTPLINSFQNTEICLTAGPQTEAVMKDLLTYLILLFGQKPSFNFKRQSKQNLMNQFIYAKIGVNKKKLTTVFEKLSQLILPHQENYLPKKLEFLSNNQKVISIFFESCLTNEEIQFIPKSNTNKVLNNFNIVLNFNINKSSKHELLFFFRFFHFPFN